MPDRATYLARTILSRVRNLEGVLTEDGIQAESARTERRAELIGKILAIEEGITSGPVVHLVTTALPRINLQRDLSDRDVNEFATLIRRELKL